MVKRRIAAYIVCVCMMLSLCACTAAGEEAARWIEVEYKKSDLKAEWDEKDVVSISLGGNQAEITGGGAYLEGNVLVIGSKGDYLLTGEFDGRIVVAADKDDKVRLILGGVKLTSADSAAVFISKADKATITRSEGSENTIVSGANLLVEKDEELDAAIYSKADLVINGSGGLNVDSPAGHGILSKDDLRLIDGQITVNAAQDGVRGRDAIQMMGGKLSIVAGGDGMKSNNDEDADRGYISIDGGEIGISAGEDGIQAETTLQILDGLVNIKDSYEGMEAQYMRIAGGEIHVHAQEDGLNAAGGDEGETSRNPFAAGHQSLLITGGILHINAAGDGIDSNGALHFAGGEVYVSGPTGRGNGALDSSGEMKISGGVLLATGSSDMAGAPQADGQVSTMIDLKQAQPGGAAVSVRNAAGEELAAFTPEKEWTNIVISVLGAAEGEEIQLYVNDALVAAEKAGQGAGRGMKGPGGWFR